MKITLFPFLGFETYTASVKGDVITINGEAVDLSPLQEGYRILGKDINNKFFVPTSYVERKDGEISLTLYLNVHLDTDEKWRNPKTPTVLTVTKGKVPLPDTTPPKEPEIDIKPLPTPEVEEVKND